MCSTTDCYIIAEAGVNHNGSLDRALDLVAAAAEAKADAIKFQTFKASAVVTTAAQKAPYQERGTEAGESQLEMLASLELSGDDHRRLASACADRGIQFLSTPFDLDSATFLARELDLPVLKIGSGELTNAQLLLHIAQLGKPVILSTGMAMLGEVETALGVLAFGYVGTEAALPSLQAFREAYCSDDGQSALKRNVRLLHCTTEYPAPVETINLRAMDTLAVAFGLPVGLSDHSSGISVPIAAAARGASVIEKHFTLDRDLPGPDHLASLTPAELQAMVQGIREAQSALGSPVKAPVSAELANEAAMRKSLVSVRAIGRGEPFTPDNLAVKRPGTGISPVYYWSYLGRAAARDYDAEDLIDQ